MRFSKTNRLDDPGVEHTEEEVAAMFLASDDLAEWRKGGELLDRCLARWVLNTLGGWDPADWDALADEVCFQVFHD